MTCLRVWLAALVVAGAAALSPAWATALQDMSYWISMRGITEDAQPSFVVAAFSSTGAYTSAFAGCNGHTFYLTAADAATVQASRSAGDTIQLHRGAPGTQPAQAGIVCLIQVDQ